MAVNSKEEDFKKTLGCEYILTNRPQYLAIYSDRVESGYCGMFGKMKEGTVEQRINYDDVASVTIIFSLLGKQFTVDCKGNNKSTWIVLNKKNKKIAEEALDYINEKLDNLKSGKTSSETNQDKEKLDIPQQIKKLSDLKDQGILTEEEFQSKKKDLLDKM